MHFSRNDKINYSDAYKILQNAVTTQCQNKLIKQITLCSTAMKLKSPKINRKMLNTDNMNENVQILLEN